MGLPETYENVRKTIVAFTCKRYPKRSSNDLSPSFPTIIGTGFIVDPNGLIATNDHVVQYFSEIPKPPGCSEKDLGVEASFLYRIDEGLSRVSLQIIGVSRIEEFHPGEVYYGPSKPDVAFVLVKARGLPSVTLVNEPKIKDGERVATAGFPMGTDSLKAPGWLHQIAPTLQEGIISSTLPFPCEAPHGYAINVMTQGGASGSPVFLPDNGRVIGVLWGGLLDEAITDRGDIIKSPTNISYVVSSHYLAKSLNMIKNHPEFILPPDTKTIEEIIELKISEKGVR